MCQISKVSMYIKALITNVTNSAARSDITIIFFLLNLSTTMPAIGDTSISGAMAKNVLRANWVMELVL